MDTEALIQEHISRIARLAVILQPIAEKVVLVGASAVLLHWLHVRQGLALQLLAARPTEDIDIAVNSPALGRKLVSAHKDLMLQALCPQSADDGGRGVGFLPYIELALEDYISVMLPGGSVIRAAGVASLYVLKTEALLKPHRAKKGSDLRDLYFLLVLYGGSALATEFHRFSDRSEVVSSLQRLRSHLADESAPGYKLLFDEIEIPRTEETWVIARFDDLFYELKRRGFSL